MRGPCRSYLNNYVREYIHEAGGDAKAGNLYTIVDAKWQDQIAEWKAIDPEIDASNCKWFYEGSTIEGGLRRHGRRYGIGRLRVGRRSRAENGGSLQRALCQGLR